MQALQVSGMSEEEMAEQMAVIFAESGLILNIMMAVGAWLVIAIFQLVLLTKYGQTIGPTRGRSKVASGRETTYSAP